MSSATENQTKALLRQQLRSLRQSFDTALQQRVAEQVCGRIAACEWFTRAQSIAFYLPNDGEISLVELLKLARTRGKTCLLPVVNGSLLEFREYHDDMVENRFGIAEPIRGALHPAQRIDLVLMPLVAFDSNRNRLGMGGGYYDRSFAFVSEMQGTDTPRPLLIGVAHEAQRVAAVPHAEHDIRPDHIATDAAWY